MFLLFVIINNTTLVKVKYSHKSYFWFSPFYSNTTLVKVKWYKRRRFISEVFTNSNTTLVKVKSGTVLRLTKGAEFKYNTC